MPSGPWAVCFLPKICDSWLNFYIAPAIWESDDFAPILGNFIGSYLTQNQVSLFHHGNKQLIKDGYNSFRPMPEGWRSISLFQIL